MSFYFVTCSVPDIFMLYFRAKSFEKSDAYKKAYTPGSKDQVVTKQPGKNSPVHLSAIFGNYIKILIHRLHGYCSFQVTF